jgi:hypothetical protein
MPGLPLLLGQYSSVPGQRDSSLFCYGFSGFILDCGGLICSVARASGSLAWLNVFILLVACECSFLCLLYF